MESPPSGLPAHRASIYSFAQKAITEIPIAEAYFQYVLFSLSLVCFKLCPGFVEK
jgi:hypothetical protein